MEEATAAAREIGFPVMLRGGYALGGKGSGIVDDARAQLGAALRRAFADGVGQVLVEECLRGWKEIEYEVVRDARDNCITVCNMENFDPMGIHTGESIVVAPSQTLDDHEYQMLRSIAIRAVRHFGIVGECNIQYALDPQPRLPGDRDQRAPVALLGAGQQSHGLPARARRRQDRDRLRAARDRQRHHAAHDGLFRAGARLPGLQGATLGSWANSRAPSMRIGTEMKSVGEVMAIGRTFPEVLQKALRMLDIGVRGLDPDAFQFEDLSDQLRECDAATAHSPSPAPCATG